MTDARIEQLQSVIFESVFAPGDIAAAMDGRMSPVFQKICSLDESTVNQVLGPLGVHLREFAQVVDFSHPEIVSLCSGALIDDNAISRRITQTIDAWLHARERKWDEILPLYRKIARYGLPSTYLKLRSPKNDPQLVRFVADPSARDQLRRTKQPRRVELHAFYKKGENAWFIQPENFDLFVPRSKNYEAQITAAQKKAAQLKEAGCESMAKAVADSVTQFMEIFQHQHCHGFYRLTATNAAIILAKAHGYTVQSPARSQDARMVKVPDVFRPFFKTAEDKDLGDVESQLIAELQNMVAEVAAKEFGEKKGEGSPVAYHGPATLIYTPTLYPLASFVDSVYEGKRPTLKKFKLHDGSEGDAWDLVNWLETFPALGGRPLFDHFLVMVPSPQPLSWDKPAAPTMPAGSVEAVEVKPKVATKTRKKTEKKVEKAPEPPKPAEAEEKKEEVFSVTNGDKVENFATSLEAKIFLDRLLVQQGLVTPVLLGEREGQCYFLSFWC